MCKYTHTHIHTPSHTNKIFEILSENPNLSRKNFFAWGRIAGISMAIAKAASTNIPMRYCKELLTVLENQEVVTDKLKTQVSDNLVGNFFLGICPIEM